MGKLPSGLRCRGLDPLTLYDVFDYLERGPIGEAIRMSHWLFPVIEAFHLIGLVVLGGAVLVVDLRLLGLGLSKQSISRVTNAAKPALFVGIAIMFGTGIPLALSEMIKLYYNRSFWVKVTTLLIVLCFTFAVKHPLIRNEHTNRIVLFFVGLASMSLWFTVAGAGRWIGFSS